MTAGPRSIQLTSHVLHLLHEQGEGASEAMALIDHMLRKKMLYFQPSQDIAKNAADILPFCVNIELRLCLRDQDIQ